MTKQVNTKCMFVSTTDDGQELLWMNIHIIIKTSETQVEYKLCHWLSSGAIRYT
jgi:hypothetical protein